MFDKSVANWPVVVMYSPPTSLSEFCRNAGRSAVFTPLAKRLILSNAKSKPNFSPTTSNVANKAARCAASKPDSPLFCPSIYSWPNELTNIAPNVKGAEPVTAPPTRAGSCCAMELAAPSNMRAT